MSSLRFLIHRLQPFLIRSFLQPGEDLSPDRVELLSAQKELTTDRIYLGEARSIPLLERAQILPGAVILFSNCNVQDVPAAPPSQASLLFFNCSLAKLYNTIADASAHAERWQRAFQELTDHGGGLHAIVDLTARFAEAPVLLTDQNGRVVASSGSESSGFLTGQVAATGALPARTVESLFPNGPSEERGAYAVPGTDLILYGRRMFHDGALFGLLLVEARRPLPEWDMYALCDCAAGHLSRRLLSRDLDRLGSSTKRFQQCWSDIVERRLTSSIEIRAALSHMPIPVDDFVQVVVITFPNRSSGVPYNYLLAQLREIFTDANMAVYNGDVIILRSYQERTFRPDLDGGGRLTALLARYDGYAAISNGTRKVEALRSIFLLTRRTVILAQALRQTDGERIFFHEDYSMYCLIDLCVQRYLEIEGNEDVLYLIHPAVIHLTRYDRQHNNNLRDVLYYYLLNDRNLVKTAAATYMHRNTVINKMSKIMDLIHLDLEDGNLRQRLMLSCQFIRYYEKVMEREFRP